MKASSNSKEFQLFCVIVNFGLGSKVLKISKETGISGGTIFLGKGTAKNRLLEFLDLGDIRKEIVLVIAEKSLGYKALQELNKKLQLNKPNHGIAFTIPVANLFGVRNWNDHQVADKGGNQKPMFNAIFTVVEKGMAELVLEAANAAGSRGATVFNARGSGIHENIKLFGMTIEPEKEVVLILTESNLTEPIVSAIRSHLKIDDPGKGIIFVLNVNEAYGLY
ncbi:MAG: P-II family nitrogen regulator [Syntrophomonadaceae bacterium]|jgi:nitrogen regulatory protein PII